jgi:colicin import membrane protein
MPDKAYAMLLAGAKKAFEDAEEKAAKEVRLEAEAQVKQDLFDKRERELLPLSDFCKIEDLNLDTTEAEFKKIFDSANKAKKAAQVKIDEDAKAAKVKLAETEKAAKKKADEAAKTIAEEKIKLDAAEAKAKKLQKQDDDRVAKEKADKEAQAKSDREAEKAPDMEKIKAFIESVPLIKAGIGLTDDKMI